MNKGIKNDFFKRNEKFILNIVIIISICGLIASLVPRFTQTQKSGDTIVNYINNVADVAVGGIFAGSQTTQTFDAIGDLNAIDILFSTYERQNSGQVEVQLKRVVSNEVLYSTMLDVSTLKDNEYARIELERPINMPDKTQLMLVINGIDGTNGNAVSMHASKTDIYQNGTLEVNGIKQDGDLVFNVETVMPVSQAGYWITATLITLLLVAAYIIFEIVRTRAYTKMTVKQAIAVISVVTVLLCLGISIIAYEQAVFTAISSETVTQQVSEDTVGGIYPNVQVKQTFTVEKNFTGVALRVGTYARRNIGEMDVVVRQSETGRVIYSTTISLEGLTDNAYKRINFGKIESCPTQTQYEVLVTSPVSMQDNVVTMWKSGGDSYSGGELYLNGVPQDGDLCFKLYGAGSISSIIFYWTIVCAVTIILTAAVIYLYLKKAASRKLRGASHAPGDIV